MLLEKKTLRKIFVGVFACIVLYWLLHETDRVRSVYNFIGDIVSPFVVGASLAFILNVPMRGFEGLFKRIKNFKLRRSLSVVLTFLALGLVLTGVFLLLIPQLSATIESLIPTLTNFVLDIENNIKSFLYNNPELLDWMIENTDFETFDWAGLVQKLLSTVGDSVSAIVGTAVVAIGSITDAMIDFFISIVFAVYCLFQKETLARQGRKLMYAFLPEKFSDRVIEVLRLTNGTFSNFLAGQGIEVCILGTLFAISMAIFRMPYIPLVSVLVAVTAFIPVVGAWVGCVLGAFFILVANPLQAVWFVIMFIILQQIENNLIYPRVVGTSIGLSGMWVLVAVGVGGELMGVAGMFLMIPVASVLYTLLQRATNKKLGSMDIDPEKIKVQPPLLNKRKRWFKPKSANTQNSDNSAK